MSEPVDYNTPFARAAAMPTPDLGGALISGVQEGLQQQVQQAQIGRQLALQHELDAATQQFITNPTAQNVRALAALNPQGFSAINQAHTQQTQDVQRQNLQDLSAVRGLLRAGRADDAKAMVQQRIDADRAAGVDTSGTTTLLNAISADPQHAAGVVDYMLAGIMGPEKWADTFGATESNARADAEERGKLEQQAAETAQTQATTAKTQAETQQITNPRPETAVAGTDVNGNPLFYNPKGAPPNGVGGVAVTPDMQNFVQRLQADENSTGNPAAKNPNSSATGNGQFINSTWLQLARQVRPDLASASDADVLKLRSDPGVAAQVTTAYAQQNAQVLAANGLPVNGATLAMAHKLGPNGAHAVLVADPGAKLADLLPREVIAANPQLAKLTAGQYAQGLAQKFGTYNLQAGPTDPTVTGEDYLATLPPGRARQVRAIASGDMPAPTGRAAMTGPGQALMQQVLQYDPTATTINLPTRQATRKAFTTGPEGQAINSANTVIGHIVGLKLAADQLHNGGVPLFNATSQGIRTAVGDQQTQAAVNRFNFYKVAVANELTKVFRGSNGAEADVQGWTKQLKADSSPAQFDATVTSMLDAMQSRLQSLGSQYSQGMGKAVDGIQLLSPHAQQQLRLLETGQAAARAPSSQSVALLRQRPELATQFDQQYGPGASKRYLGAQ